MFIFYLISVVYFEAFISRFRMKELIGQFRYKALNAFLVFKTVFLVTSVHSLGMKLQSVCLRINQFLQFLQCVSKEMTKICREYNTFLIAFKSTFRRNRFHSLTSCARRVKSALICLSLLFTARLKSSDQNKSLPWVDIIRQKGEKCVIVTLFEFDSLLVIKVRAFVNGILCLDSKSVTLNSCSHIFRAVQKIILKKLHSF